MTTYYVALDGSDGAAGTSWGVRWATIGKALSTIASGDTVYIAPGIYRENLTPTMTSAVAETRILGDVTGSHTSGVPGEVRISGWTTDTTATTNGTMYPNNRDYLTFENITWEASNGDNISSWTLSSTNLTFRNCYFHQPFAGRVNVYILVDAGSNASWLFENCIFNHIGGAGSGGGVSITFTKHTADYDAGIVFRNCVVMGGRGPAIGVGSTGAGAGLGGGVTIDSCTIQNGNEGVYVVDSGVSSTYPVVVKNSIIYSATTGLRATTLGQLIESYNSILAATSRTNVAAGTGSQVGYAPMLSWGQEYIWGGMPRVPFTPLSNSPLLDFGAASLPSTDLLGRPRSTGVQGAIGALERHDVGIKETAVTSGGATALKIIGAGDHDIEIPVDPSLTTISVMVYYDANHGTTNPPQATLVANSEIGYAGETVAAAAAVGSWLTINFTPFTPTGKSYIKLRLQSRADVSSGYAIFDSIRVM